VSGSLEVPVNEYGWPAVDEPPDPLPEVVGDALREARISLWRDLWAKVEGVDQAVADATAELRAENARLRHNLVNMKRHHARKRAHRR
jgi:hypothetical protein